MGKKGRIRNEVFREKAVKAASKKVKIADNVSTAARREKEKKIPRRSF